jgi:hypothetical protein
MVLHEMTDSAKFKVLDWMYAQGIKGGKVRQMATSDYLLLEDKDADRVFDEFPMEDFYFMDDIHTKKEFYEKSSKNWLVGNWYDELCIINQWKNMRDYENRSY